MFRWRGSDGDIVARLLLGLSAATSASVVILIVWFLFRGAQPVIEAGLLPRLLTDAHWRPGSSQDPQFGLAPMLVGSVLVTALAILLAAPLGVLGAVFHRFYLPATARVWNERLLALLAGVPSVVFGFWGLMVLVPAINRLQPPGQSLLAGGIVLAIMILPTVALTSVAALRAVPSNQLLAAAGLGLGRARTIVNIALPAARGGVGTGILLATARAIGETMAVVMVCGNIPRIPGSIFDPVRPVTATIALEMGYAGAEHRALLFSAGLILVLVTGALVGWQALTRRSTNAVPA